MQQLCFFETSESPVWKQANEDHQKSRVAMLDVIKVFCYYAKKQNGKNSKMYYKHFTDLSYKMSGYNPKIWQDSKTLKKLSNIEKMITQLIREGMGIDKEYHAIYDNCKTMLKIMRELLKY